MSRGTPQAALPTVWGSMLLSVTAFGGYALWFAPSPEHAEPTIALVLATTAFVPAVLSLGIGRWFTLPMPAQSVWMVRWAMGEAVALVGLMVRLLGAPLIVAGPLFFLGFVLVAAQYPRAE